MLDFFELRLIYIYREAIYEESKNLFAICFIFVFSLGCVIFLSACEKDDGDSPTITNLSVETINGNNVYEMTYYEDFEFNEYEFDWIFDVTVYKSDGTNYTVSYDEEGEWGYSVTLPEALKSKPYNIGEYDLIFDYEGATATVKFIVNPKDYELSIRMYENVIEYGEIPEPLKGHNIIADVNVNYYIREVGTDEWIAYNNEILDAGEYEI